jgi:hypothetical protein
MLLWHHCSTGEDGQAAAVGAGVITTCLAALENGQAPAAEKSLAAGESRERIICTPRIVTVLAVFPFPPPQANCQQRHDKESSSCRCITMCVCWRWVMLRHPRHHGNSPVKLKRHMHACAHSACLDVGSDLGNMLMVVLVCQNHVKCTNFLHVLFYNCSVSGVLLTLCKADDKYKEMLVKTRIGQSSCYQVLHNCLEPVDATPKNLVALLTCLASNATVSSPILKGRCC